MLEFHQMSLDDRLLKAISKMKWEKPTLIQEKGIPLILSGKDVLARARTGSGKTAAFALPVLQHILKVKGSAREQKTRALILAPTKELSHQIADCFFQLSSYATRDVKIVDISSGGDLKAVKGLLSDHPDIVVSTPTRILSHLQTNNIHLRDSLEFLVVDEADLLFSFGYEEDLKNLLSYLPNAYQTVLASATLSEDVIELKKLVLNNPVILKLQEPMIAPTSQLAHYVIRAEEEDKFVLVYALFKLSLVRGKSLIFVNTVDRSYKVKLYLEQFGIKACVLNSELPQVSRWHTVQQFNLGAYNIIIASDDRHLDEEPTQANPKDEETSWKKSGSRLGNKDKESGVSRGIDFQFVSNVINFDFPLDSSSYLHRVGRTARGNNKGAALSFINIREEALMTDVEKLLEDLSGETGLKMKPFNFKMEEVEGFRYRAKDAWKAITRIAVREARLKEIRTEIMNSAKLKVYFESNPNDLNALRHDKQLHTVKQQDHLKNIPEYIVPSTLRQYGRSSRGTTNFHSNASRKKKSTAFSKKRAEFKKRQKDPLHSMEFSGFGKKKRKNT